MQVAKIAVRIQTRDLTWSLINLILSLLFPLIFLESPRIGGVQSKIQVYEIIDKLSGLPRVTPIETLIIGNFYQNNGQLRFAAAKACYRTKLNCPGG